MSGFEPIPADPYPWPFDQQWSACDTVVLAVDFHAPHALSEAAISAANAVLAWARKEGILVVHTRETYRADGLDLPAVKRAWQERQKAPLVNGAPAFIETLKPLGEEPVIDRPARNPFLASDLHNLLLKYGARNLIMLGGSLEGSTHTAVCAANDRGYEVLLLENACGFASDATRIAVLQTTVLGGGLFGVVAPSEALLETFSAPSIPD